MLAVALVLATAVTVVASVVPQPFVSAAQSAARILG
jgi:hypothetical protein